MEHSAIIVNHRVSLPGTVAHGSVASHGLSYIATRIGAVQSVTEDDLLRQEQNERMQMLGYINYRPGAVAIDTESRNALFNQQGSADIKLVRKQLAENQGAIITSVVTVRREDAEALRLENRQDFERFLRARWSQNIEQIGVIPADRIEWVAAYHVNSDKNYHVHVFTWDKEGRFDSLLPKQAMEQARQALVYEAMEPQRQRVSLERTQARDQAIALMQEYSGKGLREKIHLPEKGAIRYGSLAKRCPEARRQVDAVVEDRFKADPRLGAQMQRFRESVERHADLQGLSGFRRETYITQAVDDLRARLGNVVIKQTAVNQKPERNLFQMKPDSDLGEPILTPCERRKMVGLSEELSSNLTTKEQRSLLDASRQPTDYRRKCPLLNKEVGHHPDLGAKLASVLQAGGMIGRLSRQVLRSAVNPRRDTGEQEARLLVRLSLQLAGVFARSIVLALRSCSVVSGSGGLKLTEQIKNTIQL